MKYDALILSFAGDKYLGTPYSEMDCQKFVEKCMQACGLYKDLRGSNAWYRECIRNGWTGTPEECVRKYGEVPKGALLFIHAFDGGEEQKGYHDGLGNAKHIGIKTGRNDGAIHSSQSRGCVATSKFKDKTIPNGGWNRVGLLNYFSYGNIVNWVDQHEGIGEKPKEEDKVIDVVIKSENGGIVFLRAEASKNSVWLSKIPSGSKAKMVGGKEGWSKIQWNGQTGWVMSQFVFGDDDLPSEDPNDFGPGDLDNEPKDDDANALLAEVYRDLKNLCDRIESLIGRG